MKNPKQSFNPDPQAAALLEEAAAVLNDKTTFINTCIARAGLDVLESIHSARAERLERILKRSAPPKKKTA